MPTCCFSLIFISYIYIKKGQEKKVYLHEVTSSSCDPRTCLPVSLVGAVHKNYEYMTIQWALSERIPLCNNTTDKLNVLKCCVCVWGGGGGGVRGGGGVGACVRACVCVHCYC